MHSYLFFLIALDVVTIMVDTSNARVINATTGEVTVEWVEPGNGCGCNCISNYTVRANGNDLSTTDCSETEATVQLQLCEEHNLTIVPVLNNGITVESSSSNVVPVLIGKLKFPAQQLVVGNRHTSTQYAVEQVQYTIASFRVFLVIYCKENIGKFGSLAMNTVRGMIGGDIFVPSSRVPNPYDY